MKGIHILVEEDLYNEVKKHARIRGMTLAEFIRQALKQAIGITTETEQEIPEIITSKEFNEVKKQVEELQKKYLKIQEIIKKLETNETLTTKRTRRIEQPIKGAPPTKSTLEKAIKTSTTPNEHATPSITTKQPPKRTEKKVKRTLEELILKVILRDPNKTWTAREISNILLDEGEFINPESVKNRMLRMYNHRKLEKVQLGQYKIKKEYLEQLRLLKQASV